MFIYQAELSLPYNMAACTWWPWIQKLVTSLHFVYNALVMGCGVRLWTNWTSTTSSTAASTWPALRSSTRLQLAIRQHRGTGLDEIPTTGLAPVVDSRYTLYFSGYIDRNAPLASPAMGHWGMCSLSTSNNSLSFFSLLQSRTKCITANCVSGSLFSVALKTCETGNEGRSVMLRELWNRFVFGKSSAPGPAAELTTIPLSLDPSRSGTGRVLPHSSPNRCRRRLGFGRSVSPPSHQIVATPWNAHWLSFYNPRNCLRSATACDKFLP